jgi:hypothetical protein
LNALEGKDPGDRRGQDVHTALIVLHAAAGVAAFVAGCLVLRPPDAGPRARRLFQVYLVSLGSMVVFLLGAMAAHWRELGTTEQVVYGGLLLLGLFMVWRAMAAGSLLRRRGDGWRLPYMGHVGFTLIALWDGFVIVLAIDLGAPGWLVAALAVLGVVAGNRALHRAEARARAAG